MLTDACRWGCKAGSQPDSGVLRGVWIAGDMIDLHSHILPGVDDGAPDVETSVEMAKMAVADGVEVMACTPHFMQGLYNNEAQHIRKQVAVLNDVFHDRGIDLALVTGADAHIRPDLTPCLQNGAVLTLHDTRYFLFEPSHTTIPPRLDEFLFNIQVAGFVPILTHPERMKWMEQHFDLIRKLTESGVWMQITAGSLTGRFGARPKYWAQRLLAEGCAHIIATDAHNTKSRPPLLAEAFEVAKAELGLDEATNLVVTRPSMVLENAPPESVPALAIQQKPPAERPFWRKIFS
jgi:protein-tyrosine phosphatase